MDKLSPYHKTFYAYLGPLVPNRGVMSKFFWYFHFPQDNVDPQRDTSFLSLAKGIKCLLLRRHISPLQLNGLWCGVPILGIGPDRLRSQSRIPGPDRILTETWSLFSDIPSVRPVWLIIFMGERRSVSPFSLNFLNHYSCTRPKVESEQEELPHRNTDSRP